jgi:hypothetical protein
MRIDSGYTEHGELLHIHIDISDLTEECPPPWVLRRRLEEMNTDTDFQKNAL